MQKIFLSRAHEVASRGNEMASRYHESIIPQCPSRYHKMLSRAHEIIFSKRQRITLRLLYAIGRPSVVCRLSVCRL